MSFQDRLNATAEKNKRAVPPIAAVQNATTNHSYTQGKSAVQGAQGVGQGSRGWEAQINPVINSITKTRSYDTPQITDKLITQKGFNQALQVIGARNKMKMDMENRKVLSGVLGSLIQGRSNQYNADSRANTASAEMANSKDIAGIRDATQRRGQDNTKAYYDGLLKNQVRGQDKTQENALISAGARNNIKPSNPLDEKVKRIKIVESNTGLGGEIGTNVWNRLSNAQQEDIKGRYIQTGELPNITQTGGNDNYWDSRIYDISYGDKGQNTNATQQKSPTAQQPKQKVTGALLDKIAQQLGVDRKNLRISDDGNSIIFPDGSKAPVM